MASLRSLRPVLALAGRRVPVTSRPGARYHVNANNPGAALSFVLGVGAAGAGVAEACAGWWITSRSDVESNEDSRPDLDVLPDLNIEVTNTPVRDILDQVGASSKLKLAFETKVTAGMLETEAPSFFKLDAVLFRIEDTQIEPGKPNVVGFLAIVEDHANPDLDAFVQLLIAMAAMRDIQGQLARPGRAALVVECDGALEYTMYTGPVIGEGKPGIALP
ncbi:hypothetical protein IMSHALPRED_000102 [Imshaugia aleurites]|uniref:Uncharacterized protein n=1 Tax=Imshaugia aleurites TaxID=172621 RepID=A0A8H3EIC7_9LECA|nr:hypothetical protein IMSHALPRED_000102 [Imshaugia aleurites]